MEMLAESLRPFVDKVAALEQENAVLRGKLAEIKAAQKAHGALATLPDVLSVQEVASFLRVKPQRVREMCRSGILPPVLGGGSCGSTIRIWKRDLEAYIDGRDARRLENDTGETNVVPMVITNSRRKKKGATA